MKIAAFVPNPIDGTSVYRALGPLLHLPKAWEISVINGAQEYSPWLCLTGADVVYLQRPYSEQHIALATVAKHQHKKIWIDWDDDLTCVPKYNECHAIFEQMKPNIGTLCKLADVVSTSTPLIAQKCFILGAQKVEVIPNAIDDCYYRDPLPRSKAIVWRGGNSHVGDLELFRPIANELVKRGYNLVMVGTPPRWGYELEKYVQLPAYEYAHYMRAMHHLAPSVVCVPLLDNEFNRGKSILAGIEGALMGASIVCSPVGEFAKERLFVQADTVEDWIFRIDQAMGVAPDYTKFLDHYRLSNVNQLRQQLIEDLLGS